MTDAGDEFAERITLRVGDTHNPFLHSNFLHTEGHAEADEDASSQEDPHHGVAKSASSSIMGPISTTTTMLSASQHHYMEDETEGNVMPESRAIEAALKQYYYRMTNHDDWAARLEVTLKNATVLSLTTPLLRRMLIRSLAHEVKCLYCVLELDTALHLIERHNSDPEREGIHMIVLELDRSTQNMAIRLMEALRQRGEHPIKRQTPIIPVMMLLHSDVDVEEPLADCLEMGLAGYLEEGMSKKDYLMFFLGDIVRRYKDLHTSYQTVRNLRVFKYPFFAMSEVQESGDIEHSGKRQGSRHDGEDSTVSGESWTVGSDLLDKGNEAQVYKHKEPDVSSATTNKGARNSKYLVGVIKHKVLPTIHFSHLHEISDPRARPRIYQSAADYTKLTGLPANTKMTGAIVTPEMEPFVQKEKPEGDLNKSARGHQVSKLHKCPGFQDPWTVAKTARERSFVMALSTGAKGAAQQPWSREEPGGAFGGSNIIRLRRGGREMADEENQLAQLQRSPSRDGFPGYAVSHEYKALRDACQVGVVVNDILQYDLIVPEPQVVTSNAVNSFVLRGFKCHVGNEVSKSLAYYQYAIQLEPSATGYFYRAVAHDALGDYLRALADFNSCHKYNKASPEFDEQVILYNRAVVATKLGMDHYAIADLFKANKLDKKEVIFLTNRAMIHRRHGQFYAACEHYQKLWALKAAALKKKAEKEAAEEAARLARRQAKQEEHERKLLAYAAAAKRRSPSRGNVTPRTPRTARTSRLSIGNNDSKKAGVVIKPEVETMDLPPGNSSNDQQQQQQQEWLFPMSPKMTARRPSLLRNWKSGKVLMAGGDDMDKVKEGAPMAVGSVHAWASKTVAVKPEANNEELARSEWQAIIQNRTTVFEGFCCKPTDLQEALAHAPGERTDEHVEVIKAALEIFPIFYGVPSEVVREAASLVEYRLVSEGKYIALHGHAPDALFLILSGKVTVKLHNTDETNVQLYSLQRHECFGDMALVDPARCFLLETYVSEGNCELLLLLRHDFDRLLHRHVFNKLKQRYIALKKLHIFQGWSLDQLTRLARMGQVRSYPAGTVILKQSEQPPYLYVLLKGAVIVSKVPSRFAELQQIKLSIEQQVTRIRTKYAYHHSIKAKPKDSTKALAATTTTTRRLQRHSSGSKGNSNRSSGLSSTKTTGLASTKTTKRGNMSSSSLGLTPTEEKKRDLLKQLAEVEAELKSLQGANHMHHHHHHHHQHHPQQQQDGGASSALSSSSWSEPVGDRQIRTLTPPALFGEECILDPQRGMALGSFTAETRVEVLYIHKVAFQTFRIQDSFLSRLQSKATMYPPNEQILSDDRDAKLWKAFREELLLNTKKERWPVAKTRIRHIPGGKSYVTDQRDQDCIFTKFAV